jgi:hypothetical protein
MQLKDAADQGGTTIVITAGELCKKSRMGNSSTQACCEAMMADVKPGDVILVSFKRCRNDNPLSVTATGPMKTRPMGTKKAMSHLNRL